MADYLDQLVQRGVISDDAAARMMTHRAEQPNPVRPIVDAARGYLQSGDFNPVHEPGTQPADYLRELARNPAIRAKGIEQASNFNFGGVTKAVEKIVGAAFLHQGKIYSGPNHIMALDDARNAGIRGEDVIKRGREGFLTSENRFVDRKEAAAIADAADQWRGPFKPSSEALEDAKQRGIAYEALKPLPGKLEEK